MFVKIVIVTKKVPTLHFCKKELISIDAFDKFLYPKIVITFKKYEKYNVRIKELVKVKLLVAIIAEGRFVSTLPVATHANVGGATSIMSWSGSRMIRARGSVKENIWRLVCLLRAQWQRNI